MNICEQHRLEIDRFCKTHGDLCCRQCVEQHHNTCENVQSISEVSAKFDAAESTNETLKMLEALIKQFENVRTGDRESLRSIDQQGKELERRVKKFRQNVDKMLDKAEMTMLMKKDEICGEEVKVVKQRLEVCEVAVNNLKDGVQKMKILQKSKNSQKSFMAVNMTKQLSSKYEDALTDLVDGKGTFTLNFIPNTDLAKSLDSLGSINVKSTIRPSEVLKENGIDGHKLAKIAEVNVRATSDESVCTITGCVCLPDKRLVITDETNASIKIVSDSYDVIACKRLDYSPWDIVALSDMNVAVRCSYSDVKNSSNVVYILSVKTDIEEKRRLPLDGRPRAIAYQKPHLYVAVSKDDKLSIKVVVESTGKTLRTINPGKNVLFEPQYICLNSFKHIMYVSDFYRGITALSLEGNVIFQRIAGKTTEYGGLTIDNSGNVFVCAGKPYGIYRVSPDGSGMTPFVTWETEDIDPQALTYCSHDETFVVTSCNSDKAYVYGYV
ncbi:hypothetical protein ACF0H5_011499 [Mactra antiquata]